MQPHSHDTLVWPFVVIILSVILGVALPAVLMVEDSRSGPAPAPSTPTPPP